MSQIPSAASLRARAARTRYSTCPVCKVRDVDGLHVDRCEERDSYIQRALTAGRAHGIPDVTTVDLWAHADARCHNWLQAALVVECVLDLGWRPVVGSDPTRLWQSSQTWGAP